MKTLHNNIAFYRECFVNLYTTARKLNSGFKHIFGMNCRCMTLVSYVAMLNVIPKSFLLMFYAGAVTPRMFIRHLPMLIFYLRTHVACSGWKDKVFESSCWNSRILFDGMSFRKYASSFLSYTFTSSMLHRIMLH